MTLGGEEKDARAMQDIITSIRASIVHSHQVPPNRQPRHQVVPISACQSNGNGSRQKHWGRRPTSSISLARFGLASYFAIVQSAPLTPVLV